MDNYNLSNNTKTLIGDLCNAIAISIMILLSNITIYHTMKKEQNTHITRIKNDIIKNGYFHIFKRNTGTM